jgi:hypothetical protein
MMQQTDEVGTSPKLDGMAHRVELEKWPTTKSVVGSRTYRTSGAAIRETGHHWVANPSFSQDRESCKLISIPADVPALLA